MNVGKRSLLRRHQYVLHVLTFCKRGPGYGIAVFLSDLTELSNHLERTFLNMLINEVGFFGVIKDKNARMRHVWGNFQILHDIPCARCMQRNGIDTDVTLVEVSSSLPVLFIQKFQISCTYPCNDKIVPTWKS
jgi:hypothetical protein